ncbi:hypothetical protein A3Q56_08230, partial [Intoshia linei]
MHNHIITVNNRQKKNPLLKHIKWTQYEFDDITPDFILTPDICAVFI